MPSTGDDKINVVCGIPPDESGTGRMMSRLINKSRNMDVRTQFIHKVRPQRPLRILWKNRNWLTLIKVAFPYILGQIWFYVRIIILMVFGSGKLLILHPQTLGFRLTIFLISIWHRQKVYMYVLDSSYFCVRSYNHVPGEHTACIRCVGNNFDEREKYDCQPFPIKDNNAGWFTKKLYQLGSEGRIKFLSQNKTQMELMKKHFGQDLNVTIVGLWGEDWNEPFERQNSLSANEDAQSGLIVFHGHYVAAKGADWFIEVARLCPKLNFLCAHPKPASIDNTPENVEFRGVTWTTGLEKIVENALVVIVPSLWSAPIEGALVKSITSGLRVATVENETAFQSEIPDNVIFRLSGRPDLAGRKLQHIVAGDWRPDKEAIDRWLEEFEIGNRNFCDTIVSTISSG